MAKMSYREALRSAIREEMRRDSRVFVIGEDVGRYGGAYAVTKGLMQEFGERRVVDSPISEAGITGLGVGAAILGLRPIIELMYIDFITLAMDQIATQAAKLRYMTGGQISVPIVLRTQGGTGRSAGAQHSQSLESWLIHVPGLRVAMPSSPADAKGLLKSAIRCDDPVVFIEHKALYSIKGEVPDDPEFLVPLGHARIVRHGTDVTIVAYSRMVQVALEASELLCHDGIQAEILDLRTLSPLDELSISESIAKTKAVVVVSEAHKTMGMSAELMARIYEMTNGGVGCRLARVAGKDVPIPASHLERLCIPSAEDIVSVVMSLLRGRFAA